MKYRTRAILAFSLVEVGLIVAVVYVALTMTLNVIGAEVQNRVSSITTLMRDEARTAFLNNDITALQYLTENLAAMKDVGYMVLLDYRGRVVAQAGRAKVDLDSTTPDTDISQVSDRRYDAEVPVTGLGKTYGVIRVGISLDQAEQAVSATVGWLLAAGGVVLVLGNIVLWFVVNGLSRRISLLGVASENIASGQYEVTVPVEGNDEISSVATAFNRMSNEIRSSRSILQERNVQLESINRNLEDRVELRTRQIVDMNEVLLLRTVRDDLTGLPNRILLIDRTNTILGLNQPPYACVAIGDMRILGMASINEQYGRYIGDMVLKEVAVRLQKCLPPEMTIARIGGDSFGILLFGASQEKIETKIRVAIHEMNRAILIDRRSINVATHMGIAYRTNASQDGYALLSAASRALQRGLRTRTAGAEITVYNAERDGQVEIAGSARLEVEKSLLSKQIVLHYQPRLDIQQGNVTGLDAYARWKHDSRGLLRPGEFMGAIKECGLIQQATMYFLETAIQDISKWNSQGIELPVTVCVDDETILDPGFPKKVVALFAAHSVPAKMLGLSFSEAAVLQNPFGAMRVLEQLRQDGHELTLTGYGYSSSSLAWVTRAVSNVKLSRHIVMDIANNQKMAAFVETLISMAHNMGLKVQAEGVESEAVRRLLMSAGCDSLSGHLVARPMDETDVAAWLRNKEEKAQGAQAETA